MSDIIVIFWKTQLEFTAIGCQNKIGRATPDSTTVIPYWISEAVLLRGDARDKTWEKGKWTYYNKVSVIDLLGYSLSQLYPSNWGESPQMRLEELGWSEKIPVI